MHRKPSYEELEQKIERLKTENNTLSKIIESNPHGIALIANIFTSILILQNLQVILSKISPTKKYGLKKPIQMKAIKNRLRKPGKKTTPYWAWEIPGNLKYSVKMASQNR